MYPLQTLVRPISENGGGVWPTPTCDDAYGNVSIKKPNQIQMLRRCGDRLWPTPRSNPAMAATITADADPDRYPNLETVLKKRDPSVVGGQLNPDWVEWLMGWPIGWTDLKPLETDKFQQWLESHGAG